MRCIVFDDAILMVYVLRATRIAIYTPTMFETGLIIGRFQPFHLGHLSLFRQAFSCVKNAVIGIGSVNVHDEKNPFDENTVRHMIDIVLEKEDMRGRVIQIFGIPDFHDDLKWSSYILHHSLPFDVVISHNDWVTQIFKARNTPVLEIPFYHRDLYEGALIRARMKRSESWKDRVPPYLIDMIEQEFAH